MNSRKKMLLNVCAALTFMSGIACAADSPAANVLDDAGLTAKVKAELMDNPATKARQINVETKQGVVQLNGFVDSEAARTEAENSAMMVKGVARVDNNLQVRNGERTLGKAVDDGALTAKVKAALIADERTKAYQIEVDTYKGVVSLGGFVSTEMEKDAAAAIAGKVSGVVMVKNGIQVRTR